MRALIGLALVLPLGCSPCAGSLAHLAPSPGGDAGDAGVAVPGDAGVDGPGAPEIVALSFGGGVGAALSARIEAQVRAVAGDVVVVDAGDPLPDAAPSSLALCFGETACTRSVIEAGERDALPPEGYLLRSRRVGDYDVVAVDGVGRAGDRFSRGATGLRTGALAVLEAVGFAFLHPLEATAPSSLVHPSVDVSTSPRWPVRNWHIHTEHPLELTEMLNGFADDDAAFQARLPEWDAFLEWLVANGQNEVEWVMLDDASFGDFSMSAARQTRLRTLVDRGHAFGVAVGVDAPIAEVQQHGFRLISDFGALADETAQLDARVDWLMSAGFDFLSTESGTSEFTHPDATRMLAWMNELTAHLDDTWQAPARIKIHISTGQIADGFVDPVSGGPLNFNHLPSVADARLGVLAHTVQFYGLDDPAPTYGNADFEYVRDYLQTEAGRREVLWHPEDAYWVSFDIDVPLFLPLYAERRLSDVRTIAGDEDAGRVGRGDNAGAHIDGQSVFSSGFEWGYWLNDVVSARAAWDPHGDVDEDAAFAALLAPLARLLGPRAIPLLLQTARDQRALLVRGEVAGVPPSDIDRRSGAAYLAGWETFDDVGELANAIGIAAPTHQPARLGLVDMRNPLHPAPRYDDLAPLLAEMDDTFTRDADAFAALSPDVTDAGRPLFDELAAALRVTALRAAQVHGLYDYVDGAVLFGVGDVARLDDARTDLDTAQAIVDDREAHYRVPAARIASWRANPTAYDFTYLWTVHSLYYWWRDEGLAVDAPLSPCYLTILNPVDVAFGEGALTSGTAVLQQLVAGSALPGSAECFAPATTEPLFPQDDLRARP